MKYADDFLSIIRAYCEEHEIDSVESVNDTPPTHEQESEEETEYDQELFERLRDKREELAEAEQIKASRVMIIKSLKEMATELPQTVEEFGQIYGVAKVRMKYADDFLPIIRAYCEKHGIT